MELKNIWVCSIGGVGGYFGGKIAYKIRKSGYDNYKIYFLARGNHFEAIKKSGLKLHTSRGDELACFPHLASGNSNDFPSPDMCLICVKSYDLDGLILSIKEKLRKDTILIPLMNGIDIYERIRKKLETGIVIPTCVYLGSSIEKPGVVIQSGKPGFFCCGPDPNKKAAFNPNSLINFFKEMEIGFKWTENPYNSIWEKYLLVASFTLVCTHANQTFSQVINDGRSNKILREVMKEIQSISEINGIILPENIIKNTIEFAKNYPDLKPSYMKDIERGGKNEGDLFGGTIIKMGLEYGIPTPVTSSIYKKN